MQPLAAMNADPRVMEFFPAPLAPYHSAAMLLRIEEAFERDGYGLWVVEVPGETAFAGFVGLAPVDLEMPFAPAVEVGWRLARRHWGRGFAIEGATVATRYAFQELSMPSLVAYTAEGNVRSRRVMERLGMTRQAADDFLHPSLAADDPLAAHVVYQLERERWLAPAAE